MKAVSIQQPYASRLAAGTTVVVNQTFRTDERGLIAIHAARGSKFLSASELKAFPTEAVVAIGKLVACPSLESLRQASPNQKIVIGLTVGDVLAQDPLIGPYCWIFQGVQRLSEPVPAPGGRGLWEWRRAEALARE